MTDARTKLIEEIESAVLRAHLRGWKLGRQNKDPWPMHGGLIPSGYSVRVDGQRIAELAAGEMSKDEYNMVQWSLHRIDVNPDWDLDFPAFFRAVVEAWGEQAGHENASTDRPDSSGAEPAAPRCRVCGKGHEAHNSTTKDGFIKWHLCEYGPEPVPDMPATDPEDICGKPERLWMMPCITTPIERAPAPRCAVCDEPEFDPETMKPIAFGFMPLCTCQPEGGE